MTQKEVFRKLAHEIQREGVVDLLNWLDATDFYVAPASSKYHGNYEGGLVEHSLNVFDELLKLANVYALNKYSNETLLVVSLFHDLCKVNYYKISTKNVKNEATGVWEKQPYYTVEEEYPFGGHGSKSVYLIMRFMTLKPEEASAINCHMGAWDLSTYNNPTNTYYKNELAWLLHVADERATYFKERGY